MSHLLGEIVLRLAKAGALAQKLLGRDIFWWLTKFGLLNKTVDSRLGRRSKGANDAPM